MHVSVDLLMDLHPQLGSCAQLSGHCHHLVLVEAQHGGGRWYLHGVLMVGISCTLARSPYSQSYISIRFFK